MSIGAWNPGARASSPNPCCATVAMTTSTSSSLLLSLHACAPSHNPSCPSPVWHRNRHASHASAMPLVRHNSQSGNASFRTSLGRLWKTTHLPDYLGFFILLVAWILIVQFQNPFHQLFFVNDLRISFPFATKQRVPESMNFVYALYIPMAILIAYNVVTRASAAKHQATYLTYGISIVVTAFLTDVVKNAVGRPRPDFLSRCVPSADIKPNVPVSIEACTAPDGYILQDGWRSFPSGHSSFSFAGLTTFALFFAGQLHVFRYATGGRDLSRALLCLVPLLGAAMIAISRCQDYRHDVYDVCAGSALGITVAYWSYRRHWPHLSSPNCHEPHPPPTDAEVSSLEWQRVHDEEEGRVDD
ncbi:phosphatidic acid phosphatase type 2/haloperoxidase [Stachybotrys elegans]|uniref:Phosphatidic acid phosphatase type 2/haloperoxidase n=1 Tax=Stachybotrys elegans TaxID=80388 RepID=A0A8K0SSC6_9HYPO|nr:phosphatidic acid phosphatase type 2/haloperoxidase [Stachybotrys elegans]